jgi:hypothetical protein
MLLNNHLGVIIGIGDYHRAANVLNLPFATRDAQAVAELLRNRRIGKFEETNVTLILNSTDTFIKRKLESLFSSKRRDDLLVVYFSGHAVKDDYGDLYLLCSNSEKQYLASTAIPISFLKTQIERCASRRQVIILDTCYSGAIGQGILTKGSEDAVPLDELSGEGRYIIASSTAVQLSIMDKSEEYSLFTKFVLEGLKTGEADTDGDSRITVRELFEYVRERVREASSEAQTPVSWGLNVAGEFAIAYNPKIDRSILHEIEAHPQQTINLLRDWELRAIDIFATSPPRDELVTFPLMTRDDINACFVPPSNLAVLRSEVIHRNSPRMWLFVAPPQTGKTSLLTYLCIALCEAYPDKKVIHVLRFPPKAHPSEFFKILRFSGIKSESQAIVIFDDNLHELESVELLVNLARSKPKLIIMATCTPEQYENIIKSDFAEQLTQIFVTKQLPEYVDKDQAFFNELLSTKLMTLSSDIKKQLLSSNNVTIKTVCDLYFATKTEQRFGYKAVSPLQNKLYSLLPPAHLLLKSIRYLGSIPLEVLQHLMSTSGAATITNVDDLLQAEFITLNRDAFGVTSSVVRLRENVMQLLPEQLMEYEQKYLIDQLLQGAEQVSDRAQLASFIQTLSRIIGDLNRKQQQQFRQLVRRAEGGNYCDNCKLYASKGLIFCPTCGMDMREVAQASITPLGVSGIQPGYVPFPVPLYAADADRPVFEWHKLDFTMFRKLDRKKRQ